VYSRHAHIIAESKENKKNLPKTFLSPGLAKCTLGQIGAKCTKKVLSYEKAFLSADIDVFKHPMKQGNAQT